MHIRGWAILAFSALTFGLVVYIAWLIRNVHRRVESLDLNSDHSAMGEAKAAHGRVDRIDLEMKQDRIEVGILHAAFAAVKGRVNFLLHKDISEELARQRSAEAEQESQNEKPK